MQSNTTTLSVYTNALSNSAALVYTNMYETYWYTLIPRIFRDSLTVLSLWENILIVLEIRHRFRDNLTVRNIFQLVFVVARDHFHPCKDMNQG